MCLGSCDVPEAPVWDIGVTVPIVSDTYTWGDLLPDYVATDTVDGREVFVIHLPEHGAEFLLDRICPLCAELDGQTVTVPPFDFSDSLDIAFPERLHSMEVAQVGLETEVENRLGLDLLEERDPGEDSPYLVLVMRDLETLATLDSVFVGPVNDSLPSGSSWRRRLSVKDENVTGGFRLVVRIHYPGSEYPVTIDATGLARVVARIDGAQIPAVILVVDDVNWDDGDDVRLDQTTRDEIVRRFLGGRVDLVVLHDLEATSTFELSFARTGEALFSGDPRNEVRWDGFDLTSGRVQGVDVTLDELQTIASFPDPLLIGYRGVAVGTRTGAGGALKLSRIVPGQSAQVIVRLHSRLRVD